MTTLTGLRPKPTDSTTRPLLVGIKQAAEMLALNRSSLDAVGTAPVPFRLDLIE